MCQQESSGMGGLDNRFAGVGTFHAPLTSFGCAALLQASSAALVSGSAAVAGGIAGAIVGSLPLNN